MRIHKRFAEFCRDLRIESKDEGLVRLKFFGGQKYIVSALEQAIEEEKRRIWVLKCRQMGASTIFLGLDLYWLMQFPGIQGALITNDDGNRDFFRSTLNNYYESLPIEKQIKMLINNRNQLVFKNRSRASYLVASERASGNLGVGKGLNYLHATEVSRWGGDVDIDSLTSAFSNKHPQRLFIMESTARGFNKFRNLYFDAKKSIKSKAVFVTWWHSPEIYSCEADTMEYKVYGQTPPSGDERIWIRDVKLLYGHDITKEQLAWWRCTLMEDHLGRINAMMEDHPPTEDLAFQFTGTNYFTATNLTLAMKAAEREVYEPFKYAFGYKFEDTELVDCDPRVAQLKIWERPKTGAYYVLGADPAYGSSDNADRFCASVFRCYADRMVQVAEFCTSELNTKQFAWVLFHLAGYYKQCAINLEINGPGEAVLNEMDNMRSYGYLTGEGSGKLQEVIGCISYYVFRRPDTFGGFSAFHWRTSPYSTKPRMMEYLRAGVEMHQIIIKSVEAIDEMKYIEQDGAAIAAAGSSKDDRVIGAALAAVVWIENVQPRLRSIGYKFREDMDDPKDDGDQKGSFVGNLVRSTLSGGMRR